MKKREIFLISIIFLIVGFLIGLMIGEYKSLDWCIEKGMKILELNKIEINVDKSLIISAINSHRGAVGGWLNLTNG